MSIYNHFQHLELSSDQRVALRSIESFFGGPTQVFMLKGYAGSGKTTILKGLVEYLIDNEREFALMAPTGRAAKVIREKTRQEAFTIHKSIYSYDEMEEVHNADIEGNKSFYYSYKIRNNDATNKIYIIDEASMVSDVKTEGEFFRFGSGHLLSDLISYTRITSPGSEAKIIFVGDPCQLPPVSEITSRAFDAAYLKEKFNLNSEWTELKEIKRQGSDSGIIKVSAKIRKCVSSGYFNDFDLQGNDNDIFNPKPDEFLSIYTKTKSPKIVVAYKNKTCLAVNSAIREQKYGSCNCPMQKGDIVIVGGNNYQKGILNGEFSVVNEVGDFLVQREIAMKGKSPILLKWRKVELLFPDTENENKVVSGFILENFLHGENHLRPEEMQALYVDFKNRHKDIKAKTQAFRDTLLKDDYFNCILLKYGYAVTCHKAQGGEWDNVFTLWDHDNRDNFNYLTDSQSKSGKANDGFYRWAYTAVTRASKKLYALNPPHFSSYSSMTIVNEEASLAMSELTGKHVRAEEVEIENELLNQLNQFNLLNQSISIQDHFIKTRHALRKVFIDIKHWERKSFEVVYQFERNNKTAGLKTWINQQNVFNEKYQAQPALTNDNNLLIEIMEILKHLPNLTIKRNIVETILGKIQFDLEIEERFPFTRNLFDDLEGLCLKDGISIDDINHQQYKERYTFSMDGRKAVVDFEYNSAGFFGRVLAVGKSNDNFLLAKVIDVLRTIKAQEHAR
jgi:hypothetical protein